MNTAADDDFLAAVAEHFVKRRGRGAMLSPADLACLVEWERAGVGAAVAIRGIDEAFRRGGDIRSLRQCRWAVEEERRKSRRGSGDARRGREGDPPGRGRDPEARRGSRDGRRGSRVRTGRTRRD